MFGRLVTPLGRRLVNVQQIFLTKEVSYRTLNLEGEGNPPEVSKGITTSDFVLRLVGRSLGVDNFSRTQQCARVEDVQGKHREHDHRPI